MPFALEAKGTYAKLQFIGKLRIEDAAPLHKELREHCTEDTILQVEAARCLSAEYSIIQLLYSASKTVAHMHIVDSSAELAAVLLQCGLMDFARESQFAPREEMES